MTIGKQIFSSLSSTGELQLTLKDVDVPKPAPGYIVVKILASPINPSDMNQIFALADISNAVLSDDGKELTAHVDESLLPRLKSRMDQALPIGIEGAGEVIEAGEGAELLLGKTVSFVAGACYAQYACIPVKSCLIHEDGVTAVQAASSFVNPLTSLCMVETMRMDGHSAMVHNGAASNLGQMLNRVCLDDNIPLVNIVRKQEHVDLLKSQGAKIVLNSQADSYQDDLYAAIEKTKATLIFDPVGGGQTVNNILTVMESYFSRDATGYNTYGSDVMKQAYIYGSLDVSPVELKRHYGLSWSVGGWLLNHIMKRLSHEKIAELQSRVTKEINTTFASSYTKELTLEEMLMPSQIKEYFAKRTGEKYLVAPNK